MQKHSKAVKADCTLESHSKSKKGTGKQRGKSGLDKRGETRYFNLDKAVEYLNVEEKDPGDEQ